MELKLSDMLLCIKEKKKKKYYFWARKDAFCIKMIYWAPLTISPTSLPEYRFNRIASHGTSDDQSFASHYSFLLHGSHEGESIHVQFACVLHRADFRRCDTLVTTWGEMREELIRGEGSIHVRENRIGWGRWGHHLELEPLSTHFRV